MAWLMAALAILLGAIGALEAFGIIDIGDSILVGGEAATDDNAASFRDGLLFLVPGVISAFLAFTLHRTEHHVTGMDRPAIDRPGMMTGEPESRRDLGKIRKEESALWNGEHAGAYIATLAATAFGVLTLLIGFNVISEDHTFYDGMTWGVLGVLSAFLAGALHSVSHHQPAYDWDEVRILIEERVASGGMNVPGRTEPGRERRPRPEEKHENRRKDRHRADDGIGRSQDHRLIARLRMMAIVNAVPERRSERRLG